MYSYVLVRLLQELPKFNSRHNHPVMLLNHHAAISYYTIYFIPVLESSIVLYEYNVKRFGVSFSNFLQCLKHSTNLTNSKNNFCKINTYHHFYFYYPSKFPKEAYTDQLAVSLINHISRLALNVLLHP